MMKLVIERSVNRLVKTVKKSEIVEAVIAGLDINDDVISEMVIDSIDTKAIAREIPISREIQKEFEAMDFTDEIEDAAGAHVENIDFTDWIDYMDLASEVDTNELARYLDPDAILAAVGKVQGTFHARLSKMIDDAVSKHVQTPVDAVADIPGVGSISMVDRVIDRAATKLLDLCESTLESTDEGHENNNTEEIHNGTVGSFPV